MTPKEILVNREDAIWVSIYDEKGVSVDHRTLPYGSETNFWKPSDKDESYAAMNKRYRLVFDGEDFSFKMKNGWTARFLNLTNGTSVEFEEISLPSGYEFVDDTLTMTESTASGIVTHAATPTAQSGQSITVTVGQPDTGYRVTYTNKTPTQKITIKKTDDSGSTVLPGARFSLYSQAAWVADPRVPAVTDLVSGPDGLIELGYLPVGTWVLQETEAPPGYVLRTDPVTITILDSGVSYDDGTALSQSGSGLSGSTAEGYTLTVTNSCGFALPNTGGTGPGLFTRIGAALVLVSTGLLYLQKRRKRRAACT
jgi:LPXTG-motif cell wall-anchored protein